MDIFVVVAVVSAQKQESLRQALIDVENLAGTGRRKWHKSRSSRRLYYLTLALERHLGRGEIFFGSYPKPIPYFFPLLEVLEQAIRIKAVPPYAARVYVDGIDHKKAAELTNALRLHGISLERVKSRRDESKPLIRLADMWAGCIRGAWLGERDEQVLLERARGMDYLRCTNEKAP
jgi:hypothetical protein